MAVFGMTNAMERELTRHGLFFEQRQPDVVLAESAISRRLNRRLDPPVPRQALRFHLEQMEEANLVYPDEEETKDDEPYYGLTSFGRHYAVAMNLVA